MKSKLYITLLLTLLACFSVKAEERNTLTSGDASSQKDSIIVTFGDKTRLVIYGENRKELEKIMKYDLNALLQDLKVRLDSASGDTTYLKEEVNGSAYLRQKDERDDKDYVRIGLRGVHVKDGDTQVSIDAKGVEVKDGTSDSTYRRIGKRFYRSHGGSSPRKGFNIAAGLNTYGENLANVEYDKVDYDLKPFGSRFISLGYVASTTVARGKNARLHFDFGADFSWYNLMFDGNNTIDKNDQRVTFPAVMGDSTKEIQMKKTKLVVPYVNLSFMPTVSFSHSFISYLSAGVYGGYRLGSYTKLRREGSKDVDHVRKNFFLEQFRYGLSAEIGIRNFPDLFVSYDINKLYEENRGPSVRMLSFGVRLF
ncbi:hypothetical protein [Dyadobacter luticola]|uniref:PorT family protein n=1 Tax=Dyadobacter luticola TaxID=1979387 RepID=A0A5R9KPU8_9BACT|nr:hypothetical protein [Dyadobacter luticola]TLU98116.1 hypothetical protein FEN17_25370 [Dyadobacter luticola]